MNISVARPSVPPTLQESMVLQANESTYSLTKHGQHTKGATASVAAADKSNVVASFQGKGAHESFHGVPLPPPPPPLRMPEGLCSNRLIAPMKPIMMLGTQKERVHAAEKEKSMSIVATSTTCTPSTSKPPLAAVAPALIPRVVGKRVPPAPLPSSSSILSSSPLPSHVASQFTAHSSEKMDLSPGTPIEEKMCNGTKRVRPYNGRCLYKTGKCSMERVFKTNGTLHKFCDFHRTQQNESQRKLDAKKRLQRLHKRKSSYDEEGSDDHASANIHPSMLGCHQRHKDSNGDGSLTTASAQHSHFYIPGKPTKKTKKKPLDLEKRKEDKTCAGDGLGAKNHTLLLARSARVDPLEMSTTMAMSAGREGNEIASTSDEMRATTNRSGSNRSNCSLQETLMKRLMCVVQTELPEIANNSNHMDSMHPILPASSSSGSSSSESKTKGNSPSLVNLVYPSPSSKEISLLPLVLPTIHPQHTNEKNSDAPLQKRRRKNDSSPPSMLKRNVTPLKLPPSSTPMPPPSLLHYTFPSHDKSINHHQFNMNHATSECRKDEMNISIHRNTKNNEVIFPSSSNTISPPHAVATLNSSSSWSSGKPALEAAEKHDGAEKNGEPEKNEKPDKHESCSNLGKALKPMPTRRTTKTTASLERQSKGKELEVEGKSKSSSGGGVCDPPRNGDSRNGVRCEEQQVPALLHDLISFQNFYIETWKSYYDHLPATTAPPPPTSSSAAPALTSTATPTPVPAPTSTPTPLKTATSSMSSSPISLHPRRGEANATAHRLTSKRRNPGGSSLPPCLYGVSNRKRTRMNVPKAAHVQ